MIYPDTFERKIGFDTVRHSVAELCSTQPGRSISTAEIRFSTDYKTIESSLRGTAEMLTLLGGAKPFAVSALTDLRETAARIRVPGSFLSADELLSVGKSLNTVAEISGYFKELRHDDGSPCPILDGKAQMLVTFPAVTAIINRTIDKYGDVKDSASPELASIRRQISSTSASLSSIMRRVISRAVDEGFLDPDVNPVMRDGRFVLPVSPMNKRKINGIVHDESASGKTYFIEPAEMVEANNRIRELQIEEKREIARILKEITDIIRPDIEAIMQTVEQAAEFDFIRAKAVYASLVGGTMPHLSPKCELEWYHACHPVLLQSLQKHGKDIVPLDITLTPEKRLLLISGPNAGGKSVCLKTVGIIQYMAQCGLLPPVYENSHLGIFENIFIDIGDDQSLEDDLSTYSSHLRNMKFFLQRGDKRTMVLIDEFGGGTEPQIGGAIAQAILKEFNEMKMWGVITTHYQNLKNFAEDTPGLVNGSMLYDRHLMQPLFKLSIGNPGSSFAIEIARKTGLPAQVLADAQEIAGSDYVNLDRYLLDIARDKRYWENKRQQIKLKEKKIDSVLEQYENDAETLREKRREIIDDARREAEKIISESNSTVERTIREIRVAQAEKKRTRQVRMELEHEKELLSRKAASENDHPLLKKAPKKKKPVQKVASEAESKPLKTGDNVRLDGQGQVGTILEISGKKVVVNFGLLKTTVDASRLVPTIAKPSTGARKDSFVSSATTDFIRDRQLNFKNEIDVRGMRVDEALQAVTYFMDDAVQFNAGRVRILHGTGTGALRQSIRELLNSVSGVKSYRDEDVRFGGAGITVVELN